MASRILVVEDEPAIADTLVYALTTDGFEPVWAATCAAALAAARAERFDLAILDVGLPDGNGFDLMRALCASGRLPTIFLTARSSEIDRVAGLEMGADDYVAKPFNSRELTARVRSLLRRAASPALASATPADFAVDAERLRIRYRDRPLDLSRYEYRVLKLPLDRPGRVYSRRELMERAWEAPDHSLERTVDAHVKMLRAKLRAISPDYDPIVTHRGVGYALRTAD